MTEVFEWIHVIDGVTTNPGILEKQGGNLFELAEMINPKPISIEACGDFVTEAKYWHNLIPNAVIKIPLLKPDGNNNIRVMRDLIEEGIKINCTALFSLSQVILAEKAGADYVSLFAGRIDDEGGDSKSIINDCMDYLTTSELIVGSIRTVGNVLDSIRADIITIPPPILNKMVTHCRSLETVKEFEDAHNRISDQSKRNS